MNFPKLYKIDKNKSIRVWSVRTEDNKVISSFGIQDGQIQETTVEATPKNIGKKNETSAKKQAELEAKSLWKKQKRLKYYEFIEEAKNPTVFPMLAQDYRKQNKKIKNLCYVQPKLNGLRCLSTYRDGEVKLISRGNKEYYIPHIAEALKPILKRNPGLYLDGEVYVHGMLLENINSRAKKYQKDLTEELEYWIYDFYREYQPELTFGERAFVLVETKVVKPLVLTKTIQTDKKNIDYLLDVFVKQKNPPYEGIIIRNSDGLYNPGNRSSDLQKLKPFYDEEYTVVDFTEGQGKYKECVIWICETKDKQTFKVNHKCSIEKKKEYFKNARNYIGKKLTVQYNDKTKNNLPQFPVGLCFRIEEDLENENSKTNMCDRRKQQ